MNLSCRIVNLSGRIVNLSGRICEIVAQLRATDKVLICVFAQLCFEKLKRSCENPIKIFDVIYNVASI